MRQIKPAQLAFRRTLK